MLLVDAGNGVRAVIPGSWRCSDAGDGGDGGAGVAGAGGAGGAGGQTGLLVQVAAVTAGMAAAGLTVVQVCR